MEEDNQPLSQAQGRYEDKCSLQFRHPYGDY